MNSNNVVHETQGRRNMCLNVHFVLWQEEKDTKSALDDTKNALNSILKHCMMQIESSLQLRGLCNDVNISMNGTSRTHHTKY